MDELTTVAVFRTEADVDRALERLDKLGIEESMIIKSARDDRYILEVRSSIPSDVRDALKEAEADDIREFKSNGTQI